MGWYEDLMADAEECRRKAREAKTPNTAKRWYQAAEAAARAATAGFVIPAIQPTPFQTTWPLQPQRESQCQDCYKPLSQCQGHNIVARDIGRTALAHSKVRT